MDLPALNASLCSRLPIASIAALAALPSLVLGGSAFAAQLTPLPGAAVPQVLQVGSPVAPGHPFFLHDHGSDLAQAAPARPGAPTQAAPQGQPTRQPTPEELARFSARFKADVVKGCTANNNKAIPNLRSFCECYAAAFVKRYQPFQLANIESIAARSPAAAQVISVMMDPERQACGTKTR